MRNEEQMNPAADIEKKFGINPGMLVEIQKKLCGSYDEIRGVHNLSSAQVWSGLMAYVEGGLRLGALAHNLQKQGLMMGLEKKVGESALANIDSACKTRDARVLSSGMTEFFAARLESRQKALQFVRTAAIAVLGILESQGM